MREWFADVTALRDLYVALLHFPKPVIAAVNGAALGTGLGLVGACDLTLACPEATFGFPEPQRGLTAGIAIPLLNFRIGAGRAAQLLLQGQPIVAQEAHRLGIIQELVPHDLLWARAHELAAQIAQLAPESIAITKRVLNETVGEHLLTELSAAAAATAAARTTDVSAEGVAAFLQKRPPDWDRIGSIAGLDSRRETAGPSDIAVSSRGRPLPSESLHPTQLLEAQSPGVQGRPKQHTAAALACQLFNLLQRAQPATADQLNLGVD